MVRYKECTLKGQCQNCPVGEFATAYQFSHSGFGAGSVVCLKQFEEDREE